MVVGGDLWTAAADSVFETHLDQTSGDGGVVDSDSFSSGGSIAEPPDNLRDALPVAARESLGAHRAMGHTVASSLMPFGELRVVGSGVVTDDPSRRLVPPAAYGGDGHSEGKVVCRPVPDLPSDFGSCPGRMHLVDGLDICSVADFGFPVPSTTAEKSLGWRDTQKGWLHRDLVGCMCVLASASKKKAMQIREK